MEKNVIPQITSSRREDPSALEDITPLIEEFEKTFGLYRSTHDRLSRLESRLHIQYTGELPSDVARANTIKNFIDSLPKCNKPMFEPVSTTKLPEPKVTASDRLARCVYCTTPVFNALEEADITPLRCKITNVNLNILRDRGEKNPEPRRMVHDLELINFLFGIGVSLGLPDLAVKIQRSYRVEHAFFKAFYFMNQSLLKNEPTKHYAKILLNNLIKHFENRRVGIEEQKFLDLVNICIGVFIYLNNVVTLTPKPPSLLQTCEQIWNVLQDAVDHYRSPMRF